jgi:hypothetical protein
VRGAEGLFRLFGQDPLAAEGMVLDRRHGELLPEHLDAWLTGKGL